MAFISKIAELEEHRAKLEDGRPCPLCGATDTPSRKETFLSPMKPNRRSTI